MSRFSSGGILAALIALAMAPNANAQTTRVERSGNTYHKAACAPVVGDAARCHAHVVTDRAGHLIEGRFPPISGYAPADLRDAYKISATGTSSTIVAIVDAFGYDNAEADLAVYRAQWGLPACTTDNGCFKKLNQKGQHKNYPPQDIGWAEESALDLDMASAMCPNCTLYLVEADSNSFTHLGRAVDTAARLGAHVISNSYGGGEHRGTRDKLHYYDHPGIAVLASTGDSGFGAQSPADMPTVIAVGGTHLVRDTSDRGWGETVWHGAGSGCSRFLDKPVWQADKGCHKRTIGDVSADADPATGVAVYGPNSSGISTWLKFGGTSVSAPLVGGIFGANGGAVDAASTIYADPGELFDVTSGNNGTCDPAYLCTGEVGYDGPTGLGTPNGIGAFGN
ncbi:MAG TPA: S8 family serine peptidase [Rhizomicrobium sp.]